MTKTPLESLQRRRREPSQLLAILGVCLLVHHIHDHLEEMKRAVEGGGGFEQDGTGELARRASRLFDAAVIDHLRIDLGDFGC